MRPSDNNRKLNKCRFDVLSIPHYVINKGPSHGARHGNIERQRIYYVTHNAARRARENCHINHIGQIPEQPALSSIAIGWDEYYCARYDAIAAEDHSHIATQAERSRNENWKLVLNTSGKDHPMDQRDDYQEAKKELMRDCMRSMERATPDSTPRIKLDNDEVNNLQGQKRVPSVSTPKRVGGRTTIHQQVLHPESWQAASLWKSSSWNERFFTTDSRCFRLQAMAISLLATGSVHRTPNPHAMSRSRTCDFSRAVFHSLSCHQSSHA